MNLEAAFAVYRKRLDSTGNLALLAMKHKQNVRAEMYFALTGEHCDDYAKLQFAMWSASGIDPSLTHQERESKMRVKYRAWCKRNGLSAPPKAFQDCY